MNINRVVLLALGALVFISPAVHAGEGNFGWIYTLDLQPKGSYEFEQRMQWNHRQEAGRYEDFDMRSEIEYGLSDNLQIAGYVNTNYVNANQNDRFGETAGSRIPESIDTSKSYSKFRYESVAAELIWRITNPYTDWIGIGVYFEPTLGYDNKSFEYRLLLQKNLMDDKLILASNLVFETERDEVATNTNPEKASHADLLMGASYRFAPKWSGGLEYRYHNDFSGYFYQNVTQHAHFIGPNLHYGTQKWWATVAWRHQLKSGSCMNAGEFECSSGYVNDDHGRDEFMFKFGIPL
ncbi:DUF6662 family protein [Methylovorus sp. MP688]|jgi:opacity protein-like surface antigen|uniref:DUF6662 family protein n=1 Tax=Methylovorus sp. (strain MP688) TaxID=887061 RepID=UPI0001EC466D|nr:DUF6662 family protein [Methylovorus sp. MP688]ADQ84290.1 conserved hypothetical protein [Methylovorus sp. MP688]